MNIAFLLQSTNTLEAYQLKYDAKGSNAVAQRVKELLGQAGVASVLDPKRVSRLFALIIGLGPWSYQFHLILLGRSCLFLI